MEDKSLVGTHMDNDTEVYEESPMHCAICGDEIKKESGYIYARGDCVCLACAFETDLTEVAGLRLFGLEFIDPISDNHETETVAIDEIPLEEEADNTEIPLDSKEGTEEAGNTETENA